MIIKTDPQEIISYCEDTSNLFGQAKRLYLPSTVKEVKQAVKQCVDENLAITVSCGRTGTTAGCVPQEGAIISLERLNKIRWFDPGKGIIEVEAGVLLDSLVKEISLANHVLEALPTEKLARIGGVVSTCACGVRGFGFGSIRDYVRQIEVVLTTGETLVIPRGKYFACNREFDLVVDNKRLSFKLPSYQMPKVKSQAGYFVYDNMDLIDLFIGSEGTLGIITAAQIKTSVGPWGLLDGLIFFAKESDGFEFAQKIVSLRDKNQIKAYSLEFFDTNSLDFLKPIYPFIYQAKSAIYFETAASSSQDLVELMNCWEKLAIESNALTKQIIIADTAKEREKLFEFRHALPQQINEFLRKNNQMKLSADLAVPQDKFKTMYDFYQQVAKKSGIKYVNFGHIGQAHLHFNFLPVNPDQSQKAKDLIRLFCQKAVSLGGTVSAEHGIGKIKKEYLKLMYEDKYIKEMARLKKYFDPYCLLNLDNIFAKELLKKTRLDVVAALIRQDKNIFLCQRYDHDRYGGLWEFPGGAVEKNENEFEAIEREMLEEVDLVVKAKKVVARFNDEDPNLIIDIALIDCEVISGKPAAKDCKDLGFFSLEQAQKLNLSPADIKILDYLKNNRANT